MDKHYLILISLILINLINANQVEENNVKKLMNELFKNRGYDIMSIPVKNHSHTLDVFIGYYIVHILDLDITTHILTSEGYLEMYWQDQHLVWNPVDYGGIDVIRVSPDRVFKPDIMLYNAADYQTMRNNMINTNLLLYSTGLVFWIPPVVLKSHCNLDLTQWPFDEQECFLKFGSWTHDGLAINITNDAEKLSLSDLWANPEWDITYTNVTREDKYYECCPEPYPSVYFFIRLKRKTSLYHNTIFLPVITAMILNLLIFWFEIRSNIRFILSGISLLMLTIILVYLGTKLGFGSTGIPFAIRYISQTILTIGLTLIWSTIAYNLLNLRIGLPEILYRITTPAINILYISNDSDNIQLTNDEDFANRKSKSDNSLKVLILLIDKIMFCIFFIVIISLHF